MKSMLALSFIYPKKFQPAQIVALILCFVTFLALIYILTLSKTTTLSETHMLSIFFAIILVGGTGFYSSYLTQKQALSFTLCQTHLQHHSLKGGFQVAWKNIHAIEVATIKHAHWQQSLPWVALRLSSYEPMLRSMNFRLANQILVEQRSLLLIGFRFSKGSAHPLQDMLFDDKPYIAESGKIYRGLLAMLANRMTYTRKLLGFDLFIDTSLIDRAPEDFVAFTRRYLRAFNDGYERLT